jgi:tetratricopeptide (TPR) repeat protein
VQSAIAKLERTEEAARFEREPDDVGRWFLVPAFLVLTAAACVRERRRRRVAPVSDLPVAEPATATREPSQQQRALAAALLMMALPMLTGFDLLKRKDPNIEQGNRLLQAGKADDALKAYDRAVESLPEDPIAHFDRGVALYQLGRFPEAQKEFMRASEGHDTAVKADAYYNMGNALLKQERFKDALDAYKHTLGLRPEDRRAKWNLELALRRLKEQQQQQQQQPQQKPDDKQQQAKNDQQQQQKQDDKQKQEEQQKQEEAEQQKQQQQAEQQKQQQAEQQKQEQQQQQQQPGDKEKQEREKLAQARAKKEQPREIDKQDAEAVLDALERVEPTVQKDLARRRATTRRPPTKDY